MRFNDSFNNGQPGSVSIAVFIKSLKKFKNSVKMFFLNTNTVIFDEKYGLARFEPTTDLNLVWLLTNIFDGVVQQVFNDFKQAFPITQDLREVLILCHFYATIAQSLCQNIDRFVDNFAKIDFISRLDNFTYFSKLEQFIDAVIHAACDL